MVEKDALLRAMEHYLLPCNFKAVSSTCQQHYSIVPIATLEELFPQHSTAQPEMLVGCPSLVNEHDLATSLPTVWMVSRVQ